MDRLSAGPTARTLEPHGFENESGGRYCSAEIGNDEQCGWPASAYVHLSEDERRACDAGSAAYSAWLLGREGES